MERRDNRARESNSRPGTSTDLHRLDRSDRREDRDRSRSPYARTRNDDRRRERSPAHRASQSNRYDRGGERRHQYRDDRDHGSRQHRETPPPRSHRDRNHETTRDDVRPPGRDSGRNVQRQPAPADIHMMDVREDEDEDARMKRIMGFQSFRSTKNTKVPGNDKNYAVYKVKKTEFRQYMNREGGFNRPLSPSRM